MFLVVENSLVEVRDAPTQGNVIVEQLRELGGSLSSVGVTPCAEGNQNLLLLVEGHIAVHHGAEADGSQTLDFAVILFHHVLTQLGITVLQTIPDSFNAVGPQSVNELVLPLVRALSNGFVFLVDKNGLDACGTEFDSENGFSSLDCLFCGHCFSKFWSFDRKGNIFWSYNQIIPIIFAYTACLSSYFT